MTDKLLNAMKARYTSAKEDYYNSPTGKTQLTDAQFDKLEERIAALDPQFVKATGVLGKKSPVTLPRFMPSLDKCKAGTGTLKKFEERISKFTDGPSIVMSKLDGASVLASYKNGELVALATRGDGVTGKNITFLAPYCRNLPKSFKDRSLSGHVRMEAVLPRAIYKKTYAKDADSARAAVSGALNRQTATPMLRDIHFVALRLLDSKITMSEGLLSLADKGFNVVDYVLAKSLDETRLASFLQKKKAISPYEMDGLVVHADCKHVSQDADKPKFAFAFKLDTEADDAALTTIRDIVWKASAFGVLVPKAVIDPVDFDGVTVKHVALHNYAWAKEKGCGIGAKVRVIRSGDIIPKIVKVVKPAPLAKPFVKQGLTFDGVNLVLKTTDGTTYSMVIQRFFSHCKLDGFGPALAAELASKGITTADVCKMVQTEDWLPYTGNSKVTSVKLAEEMRRLGNEADLAHVMASCGVFDKGIGRTRLQTFIDAHGPTMFVCKTPIAEVKAFAETTDGCGKVFSENLRKGLPEWYRWLHNSCLVFPSRRKTKTANSTGKLTNVNVSFTGYRDKTQEKWVTDNGGSVVSFGSKTGVLLYSPAGKASGKVEKAREKGVKCGTFEKLKASVA